MVVILKVFNLCCRAFPILFLYLSWSFHPSFWSAIWLQNGLFLLQMKPEGTGWFYDEVFFQIDENFVDDIDLNQYRTTGAKGIVESIPHGEYYSIEEAEKENSII